MNHTKYLDHGCLTHSLDECLISVQLVVGMQDRALLMPPVSDGDDEN